MAKFQFSVLLILLSLQLVSAVSICQDYDDFSSPVLDISKWEILQDVEGQPFMEEYRVDASLENFHTQQNLIGDTRVYLVPKQSFTTGDIIEYDFNVLSKVGHYGQMVLLTGDRYLRIGIMGYNNGVQGYDELGISHVRIEFQENNLHLERTSPSGLILIDDFHLDKTNGDYILYIGSFSGHNGKTHIDYDNFEICKDETVPIVPEFNFYMGILTLLSAIGIFFILRER